MTPDFSRRSDQTEWMDGDCDFTTFRDTLRDLAKVNVVTLAHRPTLAYLERLRRRGRLDRLRPVTIVDAGSGYGDLLAAIGRWAQRREVPVRLVGVDLNPWSAQAAAERWRAQADVQWITGDIFDYDGPCDVLVSSLFTHHLDDGQATRFLAWMDRRAAVGWFVNDLHRLALPYFGFALLAWLMRWHPYVRHDGPVSIARAFRPADWRSLVRRAELPAGRVAIARRFPFRLCVASERPAP